MDYLWTPWRYAYVSEASKPAVCIFCAALENKNDAETFIVARGKKNFIILNRFPYTSGHVMIVPYAHVADLRSAGDETLTEMMMLAQQVEAALASYHPDGLNVGINLGRAAGAGVTGHVHMHVLPRWFGDTNFMSVAGETRVHPEDLRTTYEKLRKALQ
ncbi:MAG TPA: HIT domain-containing protein [Candidatus Dormibacteraeota bacterium]|nr:HIT domain-containing protein [Candidatus Dormibacteraeota bacterium]